MNFLDNVSFQSLKWHFCQDSLSDMIKRIYNKRNKTKSTSITHAIKNKHNTSFCIMLSSRSYLQVRISKNETSLLSWMLKTSISFTSADNVKRRFLHMPRQKMKQNFDVYKKAKRLFLLFMPHYLEHGHRGSYRSLA